MSIWIFFTVTNHKSFDTVCEIIFILSLYFCVSFTKLLNKYLVYCVIPLFLLLLLLLILLYFLTGWRQLIMAEILCVTLRQFQVNRYIT